MRKVGIPRSLPYFFGSLKVAITLAFVGTVVSESVASNNGIGNLMLQAQAQFNVPLIFAGLAGARRARHRHVLGDGGPGAADDRLGAAFRLRAKLIVKPRSILTNQNTMSSDRRLATAYGQEPIRIRRYALAISLERSLRHVRVRVGVQEVVHRIGKFFQHQPVAIFARDRFRKTHRSTDGSGASVPWPQARPSSPAGTA